MNGGPAGVMPWLASQPNSSEKALSMALDRPSMVTITGMPA